MSLIRPLPGSIADSAMATSTDRASVSSTRAPRDPK